MNKFIIDLELLDGSSLAININNIHSFQSLGPEMVDLFIKPEAMKLIPERNKVSLIKEGFTTLNIINFNPTAGENEGDNQVFLLAKEYWYLKDIILNNDLELKNSGNFDRLMNNLNKKTN